MPKLSPVSPRKLMQLLKKEGFECIRIRGSHHFFYNKIDGRTTVVILHGGQDIGIGLLRAILREVSWSPEEFNSKLRDL